MAASTPQLDPGSLQDALDALPYGLALLDLNCVYVQANATWGAMLHVDPRQLIGTQPRRVEDKPLHEGVQAALAGLDSSTALRIDREDAMLSLHFRAVRDRRTGEVRSVAVTASDASESQALRALVESERRLALALEAAKLGTFDHDLTRDISSGSQQAHLIYGYEFGKPGFPRNMAEFLQHVHPDDRSFVSRTIAEHGDAPVVMEYRLRRSSGEYIWVHNRACKTVEPDGSAHVWGFLADIDHRKRVEAQRALFDAQLRNAHRMDSLGAMSAGLVHEFKNLLMPIMVDANAITAELNHDSSAGRAAARIVECAGRARTLVERIQRFARTPDPRPYTPVSMAEVVQDALRILHAGLPDNIQVKVDVSDALPRVMGSADELFQVVMNLAINAQHALQASGGTLHVSARALELDMEAATALGLPAAAVVRVSVEDDNGGMTPDVLARVFEPFFSTKPAGHGMGLGLSLSHAIAQQHGGTLTAQSQFGQGARFELWLPAVDAPAPEPNFPRAADGTRIRPARTEASIVCIDDNATVLRSMASILEAASYRTTSFVSPTEALRWLRTHPGEYDLILTDDTMPEVAGVELAIEVAGFAPEVPIILLSGYGVRSPSHSARFRLTLQKPITADALLRAIGDCLSAAPAHAD